MLVSAKSTMEFPLMKLLEERAGIQTKKMTEEGNLSNGETLSVNDVVQLEREDVSIGWGAYGTKSGHPEMPRNVRVSKEDQAAISSMLNSDRQFTTAVIASLIGTTCEWLGISMKEAIDQAQKGAGKEAAPQKPVEPFKDTCWKVPHKAEETAPPKEEAPAYHLPKDFDPANPFRHSCWGVPKKASEGGQKKEEPAARGNHGMPEWFDPNNPFGSINRHSGGNI